MGAPVDWDDLRGRGESDAEAVRELTSRIESALRGVTVNLERREDGPLIECAEAIYAAELDLDVTPEERVRRMRQASEMLARLRREDPARLAGLLGRVRGYAAALAELGVAPDELEGASRIRPSAGWTARTLAYFLVAVPLAVAGHVVFFLPYRLTDRVAMRPGVPEDVRSTWKLLGGAAIYLAWCGLLAVAAGLGFGLRAGVLAALGLPLLSLVTLWVRERWRDARETVRRGRTLRRSGALRTRLLDRRRELAVELEALRRKATGG